MKRQDLMKHAKYSYKSVSSVTKLYHKFYIGRLTVNWKETAK
jgi:DNA phosphorothioation-dependent restriction protein DptG